MPTYDLDDLWDLVRSIPPGRVATYGQLGRAMPHPATGRMVGRWMANCPNGIPWWRVVNARGDLPISKRDHTLAALQEELLEFEGVRLRNGRVQLAECRTDLDA